MRILQSVVTTGVVLVGGLAAVAEISVGVPGHDQTLLGYSASTGELWLDDWSCSQTPRSAPLAENMTTAHVLSNDEVFVRAGSANALFGGLFDIATPRKLFKLTPFQFGDFASLGNIAGAGLTEEYLLADLSFDGSAKSCSIDDVGLTYFPSTNLTTNDNAPASLTYHEVNGDLTVAMTDGRPVPWIGVYSASGLLSNQTDDRAIADRIVGRVPSRCKRLDCFDLAYPRRLPVFLVFVYSSLCRANRYVM